MELGLTPRHHQSVCPAGHATESTFPSRLREGAPRGVDRASPLSEREDRYLYQQISTVYALDPSLRRLDAVVLCPRRSSGAAAKSGPKAAGSPLFDNETDTFTLDRFQVLDLKAMSTYPDILQPMLFYALHRIRERIGLGFTQIYLTKRGARSRIR